MPKALKPRGITPKEALRVVAKVAPTQPPAQAVPDRPAMLSVRFRESTLDNLASKAMAEGLTQKQLIARALAEVGVQVAPADLEDRPQPRRRGIRP